MKIYCAFLDILGTKNLLENWDQAIDKYNKIMMGIMSDGFIENWIRDWAGEQEPNIGSDLRWKIFSDSILITGSNVRMILKLASSFQMKTMYIGERLLRGGISFGEHYEKEIDGNSLVLSKALVSTYEVESKLSKYPRIAIDPLLIAQISEKVYSEALEYPWTHCFAQAEDNIWFINPFFIPDPYEYQASKSLQELKDTSENVHKSKYDWFGDFFNSYMYFSFMAGRDRDYYRTYYETNKIEEDIQNFARTQGNTDKPKFRQVMYIKESNPHRENRSKFFFPHTYFYRISISAHKYYPNIAMQLFKNSFLENVALLKN